MKEAGNLEGILLTGLTKDGVDLMESYVDRTGDVQTASYCMLQVSVSLQNKFYGGKLNAVSLSCELKRIFCIKLGQLVIWLFLWSHL